MQGVKHAEATAAQMLEASKAAAKLQAELSQAAAELEGRAGARAAAAAADAELALRVAVEQVQERRSDHAAALMASHAKVRGCPVKESTPSDEGSLQLCWLRQPLQGVSLVGPCSTWG